MKFVTVIAFLCIDLVRMPSTVWGSGQSTCNTYQWTSGAIILVIMFFHIQHQIFRLANIKYLSNNKFLFI